jgi:hypothetical protein
VSSSIRPQGDAEWHAARYDRSMWNRSRGLINPFSIRVLIGIVLGLLVILTFVLFAHSTTPV